MKKYARYLWFTVPMGLSTSLCAAAAQADTWVGVPAAALAPQYKVEAVKFRSNHETHGGVIGVGFGRGPGRH